MRRGEELQRFWLARFLVPTDPVDRRAIGRASTNKATGNQTIKVKATMCAERVEVEATDAKGARVHLGDQGCGTRKEPI
jgi:hypothetical protein